MSMLDSACQIEVEHGTKAAFPRGFAAFVREHELPRATAYRHRQRALAEGSWRPRSRRPRSSPAQVDQRVVERIVALRLSATGAGVEDGADVIRAALVSEAERDGWAGQGLVVPARSTINQVLRRAGLLRANPKKRPKSSYRRFCYDRPRDCYQIDGTWLTGLDTRWFPKGRVCIIEVLDDATRTLVAAHVCPAETSQGARAALHRAITEFGAPAVLLSDNGTAFATTSRRGQAASARTKVASLLDEHGIRAIHSSPYHPQTCGKCERHHQTSKTWLGRQIAERTAAGRPPRTIADVQALVDDYQAYYNTRRWHSALGATPAQAWATAASSGGPGLGGPDRLPCQRDADIRVCTVSTNGKIRYAGIEIGAGRHRAGQKVTLLIDGNHANAHDHQGAWIGHITIDWQTRYQGQLAA